MPAYIARFMTIFEVTTIPLSQSSLHICSYTSSLWYVVALPMCWVIVCLFSWANLLDPNCLIFGICRTIGPQLFTGTMAPLDV